MRIHCPRRGGGKQNKQTNPNTILPQVMVAWGGVWHTRTSVVPPHSQGETIRCLSPPRPSERRSNTIIYRHLSRSCLTHLCDTFHFVFHPLSDSCSFFFSTVCSTCDSRLLFNSFPGSLKGRIHQWEVRLFPGRTMKDGWCKRNIRLLLWQIH